MIYIWFEGGSSNKGKVDLDEIKGQIYTDMLRFVVGGAIWNKSKSIKGKALGNIFTLPEQIRGFPDIMEAKYKNYAHNVGDAQQIFLKELEQLKTLSLREALIENNSFNNLDTYVYESGLTYKPDPNRKEKGSYIPFPDITLGETGNKLKEFKQQTYRSVKDKNISNKLGSDKYEQPLAEFIKPIKGNIIDNYEILGDDEAIKFSINMEYNETKADNEDELEQLNVDEFEYKEMNTEFQIEGEISFIIPDIVKWESENKLETQLGELIYENFKTNEVYKNGILSPIYVTSFNITGGINVAYKPSTKHIEAEKDETKQEKLRNKYEKDFINKVHILKYTGEGTTTSKVIMDEKYSRENLPPRGFNVKPKGFKEDDDREEGHSGFPVASVPKGQKRRNTVKTHRDRLITKIKGNIRHLNNAIESLT